MPFKRLMPTIGSGGFTDARIGPKAKPARLVQKGTRAVQHQFGRLISGTSTPRVLAVLPLLPGETMRELDINLWACSDATIQADSAIPYGVVGMFRPRDWLDGTAPTATSLETDLLNFIEGFGTIGPFEFDPNSGANEVVGPASRVSGAEMLFLDWRLCTALGNMSAYFNLTEVVVSWAGDKYMRSYRKPIYAKTGGYFMLGIVKPPTTAQTQFGVINFALTAPSLEDVVKASGEDFDELSAQEQNAFELLYGGDTYIEADTMKDQDIRTVGLLQATVGTPWPRP